LEEALNLLSDRILNELINEYFYQKDGTAVLTVNNPTTALRNIFGISNNKSSL
jgi:hypothetical protein